MTHVVRPVAIVLAPIYFLEDSFAAALPLLVAASVDGAI